jgi:hypothetical protein
MKKDGVKSLEKINFSLPKLVNIIKLNPNDGSMIYHNRRNRLRKN